MQGRELIAAASMQSLRQYLTQFLIYVTPSLAMAIAASMIFPDPPAGGISNPEGAWATVWLLFSVGIAIPAAETMLLIYPTALAGQALPHSIWRAAILGAAPLSALHFLVSWQKVLVVYWAFTYGAYCYLKLRRQGSTRLFSAAYVWGFHCIVNTCVVLTALLVD